MEQYRGELICDFAQYYGIYNLDDFQPALLGYYAAGLPSDSRCAKTVSGQAVSDEMLMIAGAVDRLSILIWQNSEDGQKGKNKPKMLVDELTKKEEPKEKLQKFGSVEEFRKRWDEICQKQ